MDEHRQVDEHFIRPTDRLNNWQPSLQIHGPGTKSSRAVARTDWVRRRAHTIVRRENTLGCMYPTLDQMKTAQRSQSLSALNPLDLTSPEKLDFDQKRQLLSNHIRASWIATDRHTEARSRGLIYSPEEKPSGSVKDVNEPVDPFDVESERKCVAESSDRRTVPDATYDQVKQFNRVMQDEQECLHAFYQSLRTEVLSAPVPVTLYTRPVPGTAMDQMLLQSIEPSHRWHRVGYGRLVVLAQRESYSTMDVSSIQLQLCQPKTFYPLWSGTIALPKSAGKPSENKHRSSAQMVSGVLDTTRQLSSMLYNRVLDGTTPVHLSLVHQNTAPTTSRGWHRLSTRYRSYRTNGSPIPVSTDTKGSDGVEHLICQWRFDCDPNSIPLSSDLLDIFFSGARDLLDRALIYRLRTRMKRSETVLGGALASPGATSPAGRRPMISRPILKSQISAPCMFRHLSSLKPEDVEHFRRTNNTRVHMQGLQAR